MPLSEKFQSLFTKKKMIRFFIEVVVIIGIIFAVQAWRTKDMLASDGTVHIEPIKTVSLAGEPMLLAKESERTLLYFFAPWCRVCNWSIGSLENLSETNLNIVPVAMDYESLEEVEAFVAKHNIDVDVALGNSQIGQTFGIQGYPSYYLLDENQQVIAKHFGYTTSTQIKLQNWMTL